MSPCGVVLLPPWCQDKSFHEFSIRTVTPYPGHTEISKIEHGLKTNTLANYFLFDSLPIYKLNQSYYTKSYSSQHKPQQISLLILSDIIPNLPINPYLLHEASSAAMGCLTSFLRADISLSFVLHRRRSMSSVKFFSLPNLIIRVVAKERGGENWTMHAIQRI